jgi:hypothetical protein
LCMDFLRRPSTSVGGVLEPQWQQALLTLVQLCAKQRAWRDLLLVAEHLDASRAQLRHLPEAYCGQLLVSYMQLGAWEEGGDLRDAFPNTYWRGQSGGVQEAYWALHPNPKSGLKGLLELEGQGHPVGAMAVRGLLAACQQGMAH